MYFTFSSIILLNVAITCALKIFDNRAKMLIVENNEAEYRYGLDKDNDILNVTCNGTNNKDSGLRWSIVRGGVNRIDCETYSERSINYRVHLRAIDDGTALMCHSFENGKWINSTLKLTLDKSIGTFQDERCKTMSNVFCLDRVESSNIEILVNNETLEGRSDQLSGTYQYKYASASPDVTITCAARNRPETLTICENNENKSSNCTKDAECRVTYPISNGLWNRATSSIPNTLNLVHVVHCYTMEDGWVSGNIAQLIIHFVAPPDSRQELSTDLSVIGLSTTPRAVEHTSKNSDGYKKVLYISMATSITVVLVVIVLLVVVLRSFKRTVPGGHKNWNIASLEHPNSAMEYVAENNYYVSSEGTTLGDDTEPCYSEPVRPTAERTSSGPSPAGNSSKNTTYANFNEPNNVYSNID